MMLLFNLSQVYSQVYHIVIIVINPFFIGQVHPQEYQADMTAILGFVLIFFIFLYFLYFMLYFLLKLTMLRVYVSLQKRHGPKLFAYVSGYYIF